MKSEASASLRAKILAAKDFTMRPVSVPEWGLDESIFVRSITLLDALNFDDIVHGIPAEKAVALYVAYCLCDSEGVRVFDPAEDLDELCGKNTDVMSRINDEALLANGIDPTKAVAPGGPSPGEEPGKS